MSGRLAVDFGTTNTVLAHWSGTGAQPLLLPEWARLEPSANPTGQTTAAALAPGTDGTGSGPTTPLSGVPVIPSLIHYDPTGAIWLGEQVRQRQLQESATTFRWMKRYIAQRSQIRRRVGERQLSMQEAGRDFLVPVLRFALAQIDWQDEEEVVFTVPVESFEDYEAWLWRVAEQVGIQRCRLLDEPSAAALGYSATPRPGDVYAVVDFGGGTLDMAIVLVEPIRVDDLPQRRCRVLGKAGADLGGALIDQWLFEWSLKQLKLPVHDPSVRRLSTLLLWECERVKVELSTRSSAELTVFDPETGVAFAQSVQRSDLEAILEERELFATIDRTIRRAFWEAREKGYDEDQIQAVLLVGGSSNIPAVQATLRRTLGRERVKLGRPLDAVACGAAAFVAGTALVNQIQHDYAIRHYDPQRSDYDFRLLVRRGTGYPTEGPLCQLIVKGTYDGQTELGLAIFELGNQRPSSAGHTDQSKMNPTTSASGGLELVFDPAGAARLVEVSVEKLAERGQFWLNEHSPTFLTAQPPAKRGEPCFEVQFGIDANKRLTLTARDLRTGQQTHRDYPVVKLS